jgi:hypothetical protein
VVLAEKNGLELAIANLVGHSTHVDDSDAVALRKGSADAAVERAHLRLAFKSHLAHFACVDEESHNLSLCIID